MTEENKQVLNTSKEENNKEVHQSPLITTQKKIDEVARSAKDPRKVEAGKRLAQISREAKERKKKKILEASKEANQETSIFHIPTSTIIVSILSLGVISYFIFFKKQKEPEPKKVSAMQAQSTLKEEKTRSGEALEEPKIEEPKKEEKKLLDNFD